MSGMACPASSRSRGRAKIEEVADRHESGLTKFPCLFELGGHSGAQAGRLQDLCIRPIAQYPHDQFRVIRKRQCQSQSALIIRLHGLAAVPSLALYLRRQSCAESRLSLPGIRSRKYSESGLQFCIKSISVNTDGAVVCPFGLSHVGQSERAHALPQMAPAVEMPFFVAVDQSLRRLCGIFRILTADLSLTQFGSDRPALPSQAACLEEFASSAHAGGRYACPKTRLKFADQILHDQQRVNFAAVKPQARQRIPGLARGCICMANTRVCLAPR